MPDKKEKDYYDYYSEDMSQQANATQQYYDMAEQQRYTDLLNSKIESENAKNMALKYSQQQLANQGFASQGYGSSINAGYYNTYANQLAQAQSDYNFDMNSMRLEEQQALNTIQANDNALREQDKATQQQQMYSFINSANSIDQLNKIYSEYGYGTIGKDGKFIWGNKPEGMSDSEWTNLKLTHTIAEDNINQANAPETQQPKYTFDNLGELVFENKNGKTKTIDDRVPSATTDKLKLNIQNGKIPSGSVIEMKGKKDKDRVYLKYENGTFVVLTKEEYDSYDINKKYYLDNDELNHNGQKIA